MLVATRVGPQARDTASLGREREPTLAEVLIGRAGRQRDRRDEGEVDVVPVAAQELELGHQADITQAKAADRAAGAHGRHADILILLQDQRHLGADLGPRQEPDRADEVAADALAHQLADALEVFAGRAFDHHQGIVGQAQPQAEIPAQVTERAAPLAVEHALAIERDAKSLQRELARDLGAGRRARHAGDRSGRDQAGHGASGRAAAALAARHVQAEREQAEENGPSCVGRARTSRATAAPHAPLVSVAGAGVVATRARVGVGAGVGARVWAGAGVGARVWAGTSVWAGTGVWAGVGRQGPGQAVDGLEVLIVVEVHRRADDRAGGLVEPVQQLAVVVAGRAPELARGIEAKALDIVDAEVRAHHGAHARVLVDRDQLVGQVVVVIGRDGIDDAVEVDGQGVDIVLAGHVEHDVVEPGAEGIGDVSAGGCVDADEQVGTRPAPDAAVELPGRGIERQPVHVVEVDVSIGPLSGAEQLGASGEGAGIDIDRAEPVGVGRVQDVGLRIERDGFHVDDLRAQRSDASQVGCRIGVVLVDDEEDILTVGVEDVLDEVALLGRGPGRTLPGPWFCLAGLGEAGR